MEKQKLDKNFGIVAKFNCILTIIENIVFLLIGKWDYTVLTGSLLGLFMTTMFFYMICVSVPRALELGDPEMAAKRVKMGQLERSLMMAAGIFLAIKLNFINLVAAIIPLLFTRISILFIGLKGGEE